MPKSSLTQTKFAPGSSRATRSRHTLLAEMAREAEQLAAQGARIKELREALRTDEGKRVTQPAVAEAVGVTPRAYQDWEAGRGGMKSENTKALANYFDVTEEYIVYGNDEPTDETPDLAGAFNNERVDIPAQLDRIEKKLDTILAFIGPLDVDQLTAFLQAVGAQTEPPADAERPRRAA
jgi:transcriptional regulator with XRE-family HTH domain